VLATWVWLAMAPKAIAKKNAKPKSMKARPTHTTHTYTQTHIHH
jgi:hypothetical protein